MPISKVLKLEVSLLPKVIFLSKAFENICPANETKEVYKQRSSQLEWEINATHQKIADLENKLSNHDVFIDKAMNVCENLRKYWECGTSENKQRIQKMLFPEGLYIVPEKRTYLTQNMN